MKLIKTNNLIILKNVYLVLKHKSIFAFTKICNDSEIEFRQLFLFLFWFSEVEKLWKGKETFVAVPGRFNFTACAFLWQLFKRLILFFVDFLFDKVNSNNFGEYPIGFNI